jgi:hypothetical protein
MKPEFEAHLEARPLCSLEYWYPKIRDIARTPETRIVPLPHDQDIEVWLENGCDPHMVAMLASEAKLLGYPLFMRTDQTSGKHNWDKTCFVTKEANLAGNLRWLLEENYMGNMFGEITPNSICLRQFLQLKTFFTCTRYSNFPVAREFRVFATNGKINCIHPYWPHQALAEGKPSIPNWKDKLDELEDSSRLDLKAVARVSERFPEQWSIDFCEDIHGDYWLTDMALGSVSYHWKHGTTDGGNRSEEE